MRIALMSLVFACSGRAGVPASLPASAAAASTEASPEGAISENDQPIDGDTDMARSTDLDSPAATGMHPTPYTVDQFRSDWVPGTEVRFAIRKRGSPTTIHHWEVLSHPDADHAETRFTVYAEDGETPMGEPRTMSAAFEDLRRHAEFPKATTAREEVLVETDFGSFEGLRFTMSDPSSPGIVRTFEFASALVGPPVLMAVTVEGEVVDEMVMLSRSPLP